MSDRDVDAQFADIVAHWDDLPPGDGASDEGADRTADATAEPDDPTAATDGDAPQPPTLRPGVNPPLQPRPDPVNPPPTRPFVVWRGADHTVPDPDAPTPDPLELVDLDDDEHFEPGPLAPLPPQEDLNFWGIVVGLVAGPLILLWLVLFRPAVSHWWLLGSLGLTIGGFVLLVLRQPHTRREDDPDDGARV